MTVTSVYLLRHAQTIPSADIAREQWSLSSVGKEQAQKIVPPLDALDIDVIYSSPLQRAFETLKPFAEKAGLDIKADNGLREQDANRTFLPPAEFQALIAKYWKDMNFAETGQESLAMCQRRTLSAIQEIVRQNQGRNILICSHGEVIGAVLKAFEPSFGYDNWAKMNMPDVFRLEFTPDGASGWDDSYKFEPIDVF